MRASGACGPLLHKRAGPVSVQRRPATHGSATPAGLALDSGVDRQDIGGGRRRGPAACGLGPAPQSRARPGVRTHRRELRATASRTAGPANRRGKADGMTFIGNGG